MNLFLLLLLTHFLADYPLQTGGLIRLKRRGYLGVFLHCLIHLSVMIIAFLPTIGLKELWIGMGTIFVTHNLIDYIKVTLDKKHPSWRLALYITDQLLHIAIVGAVTFYLQTTLSFSELPSFYSNASFYLYGLLLIWTSYFFDITRYFIRHPKKEAPYKRDYKMILRNIFIVTSGFALYWIIF